MDDITTHGVCHDAFKRLPGIGGAPRPRVVAIDRVNMPVHGVVERLHEKSRRSHRLRVGKRSRAVREVGEEICRTIDGKADARTSTGTRADCQRIAGRKRIHTHAATREDQSAVIGLDQYFRPRRHRSLQGANKEPTVCDSADGRPLVARGNILVPVGVGYGARACTVERRGGGQQAIVAGGGIRKPRIAVEAAGRQECPDIPEDAAGSVGRTIDRRSARDDTIA